MSDVPDPRVILPDTLKEFFDNILTLLKSKRMIDSKRGRKVGNDPTERIELIKTIVELFPINDIVDVFVKYVCPYKNEVITQKEHFFLTNDHIYVGATKDDIDLFKSLWNAKTDGALTKEEKNALFRFVEMQISLVDSITNNSIDPFMNFLNK